MRSIIRAKAALVVLAWKEDKTKWPVIEATTLSDEILNAGYDIYSTICIIREHNAWAKEHPECRQQTFLQSQPVTAEDPCISIHLLDGYFAEQFVLNDTDEAMKYWQVYDRTAEKEIPSDRKSVV